MPSTNSRSQADQKICRSPEAREVVGVLRFTKRRGLGSQSSCMHGFTVPSPLANARRGRHR